MRPSIRTRVRGSSEVGYEWEQDFPLFARERRGAPRSTVIQLDFTLEQHEQVAFRVETGISTNNRLPIEVSLKERTVSLAIRKQGRGAHREKAPEIAKFVVDRVSLLHIPAVRTGSTAMGIAEEILTSRRRALFRSPEYSEVLKQLEELDQTAVRDVQKILESTLGNFIPGIESVQLQTRAVSRVGGLDDILIDDGVLTPISAKGDGIQSLVALAMTLEWTQSNSSPEKKLIVAVEEPESHLHPGAVHELRQVLRGIAEEQQVIVTTHSQSLVNRRRLERNVIVGDRSARSAHSLLELREALGVRLSDALASAEAIVIVEGATDERVLPALLFSRSVDARAWVEDGRVVFEPAGGGSKIYSRVLAARTILTNPIVVLDGDEAGIRDVKRLLEDKVIEERDILQIARQGLATSELEDLFEVDVYLEAMERELGFTLSQRQKRVLTSGHDRAWSERLNQILKRAGVPNSESVVKRSKFIVCEAVLGALGSGEDVLVAGAEDLIDRLVGMIRRELTSH